MSANTDYYWKRIQEKEANPVAAYQSKYQTQLDNALNAITNRKAFSYDFNADPMYQMYKDQYTKLGNEAAANAAANVSALTGGFGNSYATTAASQANQQYLTKLNEMIPELYNLAMNRYKLEGDELNNRFNVLGQAEDRDYGRYRDQVADYNDLLAYLQGAYGTQLANDQWRAELDEKIREFDLEYALKNRPMYGGGGGTTVIYKNGGKEKEETIDTKTQSALNDAMARMRSAYENAYAGTPYGVADKVLSSVSDSELKNLRSQGINVTYAQMDELEKQAKQTSKHP